ncbi:hypothetical protein F0P96_14370 [Hymenobacter busanensis]|uniref:Uncharacterized protein n=1 Tax=Hymenobacter busanensis TaxID=2607656 RepID=A0A7L4ZYL9_9BACT|nr:hypothetical protein [Hymenobacter busanensis]KAA9331425.1 hypothetical protein F0P96_14370 [Hymenobacter busanensis]QHJ08579.1 hypothetical protein GUY19_15300 [Hymenobacter busanensis]
MTSYSSETTGQAAVEMSEACDKDDRFRFASDGLYVEERGSSRCSNETAGPTAQGAWKAVSAFDSLTVSGVAGDGLVLRNKWQVIELSEARLTLSWQITLSSGAVRTTTVKLEKE